MNNHDKLNETTKVINDKTGKWYHFLDNLYSALSKYDIQVNKSRYNVNNIEDWGKEDKPQGININHENFQLFLDKLKVHGVTELDYWYENKITKVQLKELNYLLDLILKNDVHVKCLKSYKFIRGNFINVKNITNHIHDLNNCDSHPEEKIKNTIIFALRKIFIDENITSHESSVTIIAPEWEIIGSRKIDLSGSEGHNSELSIQIQNTYSLKHSKNGVHGKPGGPGGPGGVFLGIGEKFVNGKSLEIITSGGKGGIGGNGEDGIDGADGGPVEIPGDVRFSKDLCSNGKLNGFKCKEISYTTGSIFSMNPSINITYQIFGEPGEKGGNGGDGGRGGKGGMAGKIKLFEINDNSDISKLNEPGEHGRNGTAGVGGVGGKNGDNSLLNCFADVILNHCKSFTLATKKTAETGTNGTHGANVEYMQEPKKTDIVFTPAEIINHYKSYVRQNLKNHIKTSSLIKFLRQLDSDKKVNHIYDTLNLFEEFQGLEKQFYEENVGISFLPFYKSLLFRIRTYAENPKKSEKTSHHKKALNYLYTSTLSRINDLEGTLESLLVTNVEDYLMSVKKDVDELKDFQKIKNKNDIISKYRKEYKENIDEKIEEAKNIIQTQISPEIENINSQIDEDIQRLVMDVTALEDSEKAEREILINSKTKLEKALKIKALFNVIEFTSQAVGYLGPAGAFAGGVIGEASSLTESLVLDKEQLDTKLLQLPQSVISHIHEGKNLLSSMMSEKINRFHMYLDKLSAETDKNPESFGKLSAKISEIKEKLGKVEPDNFNFLKVQSLENELKDELNATKKDINIIEDEQAKSTLDQKINKFFDRFQKVYQFGMGLYELTNKFENNESQVQAISQAIERSQADFKRLKEFEETIYNSIFPVLQNMNNDIRDVEQKLGTKSVVALDITKWQVQNTLKSIKTKMQSMTQGFDVSENLTQCIDKLDETMNILINVYNHAQDYYKQQNLANYIADVSSDPSNSIAIADIKLAKAIDQLEILIRSNIILERYQVSIDAFKQFVFPFANLYMEGMILPRTLRLNNTLSNIAYEVTERIDLVIKNFKKYKSSLTKYKSQIGSGEFNSQSLSTQPFFVWENKKYNSIISKLLTGETVLVKADIAKSGLAEEAIKFKVISLNFRTKNETKQSELNDILKGFRINLTHLGSSYYRYNNKTYIMPTTKFDIWYYYEKNGNGEPIRKSGEYIDIEKGDSMLSPYALWKLSLKNLPNKQRITFENLKPFKDEIDLELSGYASFVVKDDTDNSDLELERYYKSVESYEESLDSKLGLSDTESLLQKINEIYRANKSEMKEEIDKSVDYKNRKIFSDSWLSWELPKFDILPGAEASEINNFRLFSWNKNKNLKLSSKNVLKNDQKSVTENSSSTILENITSFLINSSKRLKDMIFPQVSVVRNVHFDNNLMRKTEFVHNYKTDIEILDSMNFVPKIESVNATNSILESSVKFELSDSNLVLAHLIIGKLVGTNESLQNSCYISPALERVRKVDELTIDILNDLQTYSVSENNTDGFMNNYRDAALWYTDMYSDFANEIILSKNK